VLAAVADLDDDGDDDAPEKKTRLLQVVFAGRWRIDGRVGVGGMGNVLLATDLETQTLVAIKTLGMQFVDQPGFVRRFEREGQLLSKLNHPGLPPLIAFARHDEMPFFVMKYVEGKTLGALLKERRRLGSVEALALLRQLADVLEYLHARGVVHRDLKPDNLMIDADRRITLIDFGISAQSNVTRLTLPGVALGTPLYMAPEQITTGLATPASDVYALALLAYVMLAGRHPFAEEERAGMLTRQVLEVPKPANFINPDVPHAAAEVLRRGLEKTPSARFPSATALIDSLASAYGLTPTDSTPDDPPKPDEFPTRPDRAAIVPERDALGHAGPDVEVPPRRDAAAPRRETQVELTPRERPLPLDLDVPDTTPSRPAIRPTPRPAAVLAPREANEPLSPSVEALPPTQVEPTPLEPARSANDSVPLIIGVGLAVVALALWLLR
jgi:serine/threonine protein kinase